ncbi:MAG: 4Fe-4S cluster-binding domain-containing protein [Syntrophales bacterium]
MEANYLNIAYYAFDVKTLGPGRRIAVWVQGCQRRCQNCLSPEWQAIIPAHVWHIDDFKNMLAQQTEMSGLTVSGGEPMLQAAGLMKLWSGLKQSQPSWTLIVFSGFTRSEIIQGNDPARTAFLAEADAFIGGPYIDELNDGKDLKGSGNQEIFFKPDSKFDKFQQSLFFQTERHIEIRVGERDVFLVGIPPTDFHRD